MNELLDSGVRLEVLFGIYGLLLAAGLAACLWLLVHLARNPLDWRARVQELCERPLSLRFSLSYIALACFLWVSGVFASLLYDTFSSAFFGSAGTDDGTGALLHGLFFQVFGLAFLAGYLRLKNISWARAFGAGADSMALPRQAGAAVITYLAAQPGLLVAGLAGRFILWRMGHKPELQDIVNLLAEGLPWPTLAGMFILIVVIAPLFEESLFRGIILPLLARRLGIAPAIALASFLFAVAHLHQDSFLQLFALATVLSLAYVATGSLLVPIVMHAIFNSVSLLLLWAAMGE